MSVPLLAAAHVLAHVDAALNAVAAVLLVTGWLLIKQGREQAHKWVMIWAFAVSTAFLACYLYYHIVVMGGDSVPFGGPAAVRWVYYPILISHILLAFSVPPLAIYSIYLGWQMFRQDEADPALRYRRRHRNVARWTLPIWMYVSVTGVIVYLLLYHIYPADAGGATMP